MRFGNTYEDRIFFHQPERLTFYNLQNTCALCRTGRTMVTTHRKYGNILDIWGSNDYCTGYLSNAFANMQKKDYNEKVYKLEIYPVVYMVSEEERKSMAGIEELENKYILNSALMVYRSGKHPESNVSVAKTDYNNVKVKMNYNIVLEQSLDGVVLPIRELIARMTVSAINYNRSIKFVPHQDMIIELCIPQSVMDEIRIEQDSDQTDFDSEALLIKLLANVLGPDFGSFSNKFNKDKFKIRIIDDSTEVKADNNLPAVYRELTDVYRGSFVSNPL